MPRTRWPRFARWNTVALPIAPSPTTIVSNTGMSAPTEPLRHSRRRMGGHHDRIVKPHRSSAGGATAGYAESTLTRRLRVMSARTRKLRAAPEFARCDARAFGHRRHLRPDDVGIDGRLAYPGAESTITAAHHVLASDELRVAADPLRDELRMLDEVGLRLDDAWNQNLSFGQLHGLEQLPFVRVAGICRLDRNRARTCAKHDVDDVCKCDVTVMRPLV